MVALLFLLFLVKRKGKKRDPRMISGTRNSATAALGGDREPQLIQLGRSSTSDTLRPRDDRWALALFVQPTFPLLE